MKILIADDHALFRDGLNMCLKQLLPKVEILEANDYSHTLAALEKNQDVEIIILDLDMPDMGWEDGFDEIRAKSGSARIVIISASDDIRDIKRSLEKGAVGYIPKRSDTKILSNALQLILSGGIYLPPEVLSPNRFTSTTIKNKTANKKALKEKLTRRQMEVLRLIAQGKQNKLIAFDLGVSEATIKLHINALLKVLGVANRTQALLRAQELGLI